MIRPFTLFCVLLAGGSGFLLYTKKHETTVLDQQITKIVQDSERVRQQSAMLRTEWALLNQPDRLSALSARLLPALHPMAPTQFVRLASLDAALPAPGSRPMVEDPRAPLSADIQRANAEPTHRAAPPADAPRTDAVAVAMAHAPAAPDATIRLASATLPALPQHLPTAHPDSVAHHAMHARPDSMIRLVSFHPQRPAPTLVAAWHRDTVSRVPQPVHPAGSTYRAAPDSPPVRLARAEASRSALGGGSDGLPPPVPMAN